MLGTVNTRGHVIILIVVCGASVRDFAGKQVKELGPGKSDLNVCLLDFKTSLISYRNKTTTYKICHTMLGTRVCLQMLLLSPLSLSVYKSFSSFCPRVDVVITAEHDRSPPS